MNDAQFEFLNRLVNQTVSLKAPKFANEIWELEDAGLVSLKWDGQFFVAKPTLAGRERVERELAKREADRISYEKHFILQSALERERDEAKRAAKRERIERRIWQGATILTMILSTGLSAFISAIVPSCSCQSPRFAEETNEERCLTMNDVGDGAVVAPKQESPKIFVAGIDISTISTNHALSLSMRTAANPVAESNEIPMNTSSKHSMETDLQAGQILLTLDSTSLGVFSALQTNSKTPPPSE